MLFGSGIRIAKRELKGNPTVYAYAMNEVFDPKMSQKLLRFFSSGGNEVGNNYRWIAIPKKIGVDETTLFSKVGEDLNRSRVEERLRGSCHP